MSKAQRTLPAPLDPARADQLLSVAEFAALNRISIRQVRRLLKDRAVPFLRLSPRRLAIRTSDCHAWQTSRLVA
jgi:hypothetical protein